MNNDADDPLCRDMRSTIAFALMLAVGPGGCTLGDDPETRTSRPTFRLIDCPVDVSSVLLVDVSCGTITVPAHHDRPDGDTLQLFVTRLAADSDHLAADPVLSLGGDLGAATDYITLAAQLEGLGREVITLDARGTGRSTPSLVCPEVEALPHAPVASPVDDPRTRREFLEAIAACHDRLVSQGVDLTAFDLQEMAADAEGLRRALGIDRWNVMALGTTGRIALQYLRDYPDHVRSVVLDSTEWPGVDPFVESVEGTRYAIDQLVLTCEDTPDCRARTPHLARDIEQLGQRFYEQPVDADISGMPDLEVQTGHVLMDAGWFAIWLRARLAFIRPPGTFVPNAIASLADGSDQAVILQASRLTSRQLCQGFLPSPCWTDLVTSWGVHLAVMCRDVLPFTDRTRLGELVAGDPAFLEAFGGSPHLEACSAWEAGKGDPSVATAVRSNVPTLVIVGRFDPFGSLPYAEIGTRTLVNSHIVVSPVHGHVVTGTKQLLPDACLVRIRDTWLDDPATEPDTSCMDGLVIDFGLDPAYTT